MSIITDETVAYPLCPQHIDTTREFVGAFGNRETEASARWIVRLCQKNSGWKPFTEAEINAMYHEAWHILEFGFNKLITDQYTWQVGEDHVDTQDPIVRGSDGRFYITHKFIAACFQSSPKLADATVPATRSGPVVDHRRDHRADHRADHRR